VREADWARRIMHAAREEGAAAARASNDALMTVHAKHPSRHALEEIAPSPRGARPELPHPGFAEGVHVYNRDGFCARAGRLRAVAAARPGATTQRTPSTWASRLARMPRSPGSSGKRYVQDQPLDWGVRRRPRADDLNAWCAPGRCRPCPPIRTLTMNDQIFESVVTTPSPTVAPHVAPMGVRYRPDGARAC
jgi:hypothetical protein